jgi:hypothetical protein
MKKMSRKTRIFITLGLLLLSSYICISVFAEAPDNSSLLVMFDRKTSAEWRNLCWWMVHPDGVDGVADTQGCSGLTNALKECCR